MKKTSSKKEKKRKRTEAENASKDKEHTTTSKRAKTERAEGIENESKSSRDDVQLPLPPLFTRKRYRKEIRRHFRQSLDGKKRMVADVKREVVEALVQVRV